MENFDDKTSINFSNKTLSYNGSDSHRIPESLSKIYGEKVLILDLSYNNLSTLQGLEAFPNLEELILDNNSLDEKVQFPFMSKLRTLCINKNKISHLEEFVENINNKLPNLTFLSLHGNPACPDQLSDFEKDEHDYKRYRFYVIYQMPNLLFLDSTKILKTERDEAKRCGHFMKIARPDQNQDDTNMLMSRQYGECTPFNVLSPYTPLPATSRTSSAHKGAFGKCRYRYSGKHSEGNRFIRNNDL